LKWRFDQASSGSITKHSFRSGSQKGYAIAVLVQYHHEELSPRRGEIIELVDRVTHYGLVETAWIAALCRLVLLPAIEK
jgi:hypothetical protein